MGNNQTSNWREQFQLTDSSSSIRKAIHKLTKQRYQILTLFPSTEQDLQIILNRIKLRTSKSSPHLLLLHSFWKSNDFSPCNNNPSIDLIFKTATPLEEYLTYRRVKNQRFTKEEIQYIICKVAAGLNDIKEMKEEYGGVNFSNVLIDGDVKLKDPFLMKENQAFAKKSKKIQGYPSPQKLYTYFDTLSTFQQHTSDLFSLGILALQLIYPHQNLSGLYKNINSRYLNCSIDMNELRTYVNGVHDHILRSYVTVLTDEQPNRRREIHHMFGKKQINNKNLGILKENPFEMIHEEKKITQNSIPQPVMQSTQPPKTMTRVDLYQKPKETQSIIIPRIQQQQQTLSFSSKTTQQMFAIPQFKPIVSVAEPWRPSYTIESTYRSNYDDHSESTPINKINGTQFNSFKSPTFINNDTKIEMPQFNHSLFLNNIQLPTQESKIQKVSPKFINAIYRTSLLKNNHVDIAHSTQINQERPTFIERTHEANHQINSFQQKQNKNQPQQSNQSISPPTPPNPKQEQSLQQQVKTSKDITQAQKQSLVDIAVSNSSAQNVIKFQSMPTKMVESVNQIQNSLKNTNDKDGFVVEQYDIGTRYEGYKKNGMRNGQGQFIYKQGSKYKGQWKDNKMQGFGTLYYPNGLIAYEGQWVNDEFDGLGVVYNDNPTTIKGGYDYTNFNSLDEEWLKYEGCLKKDAKDGQGKLYLTNGQVYTGMFQNDLVHGQGEFKKFNGSIIKGVWQEGLLKKIYQ